MRRRALCNPTCDCAHWGGVAFIARVLCHPSEVQLANLDFLTSVSVAYAVFGVPCALPLLFGSIILTDEGWGLSSSAIRPRSCFFVERVLLTASNSDQQNNRSESTSSILRIWSKDISLRMVRSERSANSAGAIEQARLARLSLDLWSQCTVGTDVYLYFLSAARSWVFGI